MTVLHKFFYKEILIVFVLVTIGFLGLFAFFDVINELQAISGNPQSSYDFSKALLVILLQIPSHVYELIPISLLISLVFVLTRMAKNSEFTVLRTGGLNPGRAMGMLLSLGLVFSVLTFVIGDYVAPYSAQWSQVLKAHFEGKVYVGKTGAWLKEKTPTANYALNVGALTPDNTMSDVTIYQFDLNGELMQILTAKSARFDNQKSAWDLQNGEQLSLTQEMGAAQSLSQKHFTNYIWLTAINSSMVAAAVLQPDRMSTIALFTYMQHLKNNGQSAQRYEIQFWKKFFYPLSCLVMVVLALPFAYLHFRGGGMTGFVFLGIFAGLVFVLLNTVTTDLGWMSHWTPWFAAALPSLLYSVISITAFIWLVLRR